MWLNRNKIKSLIIISLFLSQSIFVYSVTANEPRIEEKNSSALNLPVYRAVFIGIGISQGLPYSIKQLEGLKTTLLNGGNWEESNIIMLKEGQATIHNIKQNIQWLKDTADENDVSLFYFIGHGGTNSTNQYITAIDSLIYDVELDIYLQNISGSTIVILDSCKSGGFIEDLEYPNRVVLTASKGIDPTYQVSELQAPMFSYFLNVSLSWITKNIEFTYLFTKMFTLYYGKKISEQYGENYMIYPQMSDGTIRTTNLIRKHAYIKNVFNMFKVFITSNNELKIWEMK